MPIGTKNDLVIYDPRIRGGFVETLLQNVNAFNGASRGAIRLISNRKPGQFSYESFFPEIPGMIRQRDPNSTAAIQDKKLTQSEFVSVKTNRGIGPVSITLDALRKTGMAVNESALTFTAGQMAARRVVQDYLDSAVHSVRGALASTPGMVFEVPAGVNSGRMNTLALTGALAKFGDAASQLVVWVMHSTPYYQLVENQIAANIDGISSFNVASASPVTLGRPVLVTDAESLVIRDGDGAVVGFRTLALPVDAVTVEDTESEIIMFDLITGLENLAWRMQGEYAFNLGVKGFAWDVANGGENPGHTALSTTGNWDAKLTDPKARAGVMIISKP